MELLQQGIALVAVFALLAGSLWLIKLRQGSNLHIRGEKRMQVIERVALTPQHTVCLVKIGERFIMIGTAPSSCQFIQTIEGGL